MEGFLNRVKGLSRFLNLIAGITLAFMMSLTVADVILRFFKRPIIGTFDMVTFSGAVVIGFSIPLTSWMRGHVYTDFLILTFSQRARNIFNIVTRFLGICLFVMIGWNLVKYGMDLYKTGEVSPTLQIPFYPITYGMAICCFAQCLVLFCDILKIWGGKYE